MSKGFLIFAHDSGIKKYTKCAYALALSIKTNCANSSVSIVTDNDLPSKYKLVFDNVISIPWRDYTNYSNTFYKTEDRWKLYHCSPYEETIVMDADMLVLSDINHYWDCVKRYDLFLTNYVKDYRNRIIKGRYYRKIFDANQLPDLYSGLMYFKKTDFSNNFFLWLEKISNNWELFYGNYVSKNYPKFPSMDINVSLVTKILDCEEDITLKDSILTFTHMKPMIQGWERVSESWQDSIGSYFNDRCQLKIGNYQQYGIFHYTEYSFLNDMIINNLEHNLGIN
ncbi:MAG: hypothetical protein EBT86_09790 [Actinobacteria bacterium]|nr:hypothetical protein [Actinomycetota bacterium]